MKGVLICFWAIAICLISIGCTNADNKILQLSGRTVGVPAGTIADQLVLSKVPDAEIVYYDKLDDAVEAVNNGALYAVAYNEPIMRNAVAQSAELRLISEKITKDEYAYAVRLRNESLKKAIDDTLEQLKSDGTYDDMMERWFPESGEPGPMPSIPLNGINGALIFGTSSTTKPFSYYKDGDITGFDIEFAYYVAKNLNMRLEIMDLEFSNMIPRLVDGSVDLIGACITLTDERSEQVLFSEPYFDGGIVAAVKKVQ